MAERFELLSQLGKGGMGIVWKARDTETGEIVALKLLHSMFSEDPDYIARFEREIEVARRIRSPYVVEVLGFGNRGTVPFMLMEYVAGPSLAQLLRERTTLTWDEAAPLLTDVTRGLAATHAAGVIHRDLKPSNVMIDQNGRAKLADFGIARAMDLTRLTGSITTLGTPSYMAPEGHYSVQSDLYSLGCVLFELLSGTKLFEGESMQQIVVRHIRDDPDLSALDARAIPIVSWLLQKDPSGRPTGCEQLLQVMSGQTQAPEASRPEAPRTAPTDAATAAAPRRGRKRTMLQIAVVSTAGALFAGAAVAVAVMSRGGSEPASPEWGIDTTVRTAFVPPPGQPQAEIAVGPVVYSRDRVVVSFSATLRCAAETGTMKWLADVGTSNVSVITAANDVVLAENGWGLGNQDAVLSCNTMYVGTWVFKVDTADALSLRYSGPEFEISLPARDSTVRTKNETLQLPAKLRLDEQLAVTSSLCMVSLVAPAKGAPAGPCFVPRERLRVTFGPVDNLKRWYEVTAEDGAHGWIDQDVVGVSLTP